MLTVEEIRECPFCGSEELIISEYFPQENEVYIYFSKRYAIKCDYNEGGCGVEGTHCKSLEEAIELWNTRHTPKHETVEQLRRFIVSWRLATGINEPSREFYVECKDEEEAKNIFENSHNMEVSLLTGVCDMVNVFATTESHGKPKIEE